MFGRPTRAQLIEERDKARAAAEAAAKPRWRRLLSWMWAHPWLALVLVAVLTPLTALWVAAGLVWGWWRNPGPVTALVLAPAAAGAVHAGLTPWWWAAAALAPLAVAAGLLHDRRRPHGPSVLMVDEAVATWRIHADDAPDAPAKGSTVADHVDYVRTPDGRVCGRILHVTGADSRQNRKFFEGITDRLAAIYNVDVAAITVHPVGNHRRCAIQILEQWWVDEQDAARRRRVLEPTPWRGPELEDDGRFRIMTVAADGRPGRGQLWIPGQGARPVDVNGLQGTGKSNAVHVVNASILSRGLVVMDLVDLKGGASLPAWRQHGYRFGADQKAALLALLRWNIVIDSRTVQLAAMPVVDDHGRPILTAAGEPAVGLESLDPSREWPVYVLEIDEFPQIARLKVAQRLITRGLERGRAALAALIAIHQGTALKDGYGDDSLTRGLATNGTVVALRNDTQSTARVAAHGAVDLSAMGKGTPGEAALSSPCEPTPVHGRVEYLRDAWAAAARCIPGTLEEATEVAVARLEAAADRHGVEAVAAAYVADPDRWMDAVRDLDAARDRAAAAAEAAAAGGGAVSGAVAMVAQTPEEVSAETRIRAVFAEAGVGAMVKTGTVIAGARVASSTFHNAVKRLVRDGLVADLGYGQWAATAALVSEMSGSRA